MVPPQATYQSGALRKVKQCDKSATLEKHISTSHPASYSTSTTRRVPQYSCTSQTRREGEVKWMRARGKVKSTIIGHTREPARDVRGRITVRSILEWSKGMPPHICAILTESAPTAASWVQQQGTQGHRGQRYPASRWVLCLCHKKVNPCSCRYVWSTRPTAREHAGGGCNTTTASKGVTTFAYLDTKVSAPDAHAENGREGADGSILLRPQDVM